MLVLTMAPRMDSSRFIRDLLTDYFHPFSTFSPVPKRVMNGSETGTLAAAIVSGAPMDLQARTVRYVSAIDAWIAFVDSCLSQNLSSYEACHSVGNLARPSLADGLGYFGEGTPMGEPPDGLAVIRRWHAGNPPELQVEGGCYRLC